jgi:primosomal protein N'
MKQKKPVTERRALEETGAPVLNALVKKGLLRRESSPSCILQSPLPNDDQAAAINEINIGIEQSYPRVFLLHGVTGSGKTEVYLRP